MIPTATECSSECLELITWQWENWEASFNAFFRRPEIENTVTAGKRTLHKEDVAQVTRGLAKVF